MANYNLSNQDIKDTFQQLAQVSGSIEGGITGSGVTDGTGSRITNLHVTASSALNASSSISASHAIQADSALSSNTSISASHAVASDSSISASHALQSDNATSASYALTASFATTALSASYAPNTGVTSIIAGTNITIDQSTGDVTINSSGGGGSVDTGSLLVTASNVDAVITYTKGDGSVFTNTINNVANATTATSASHAVQADSALTATSASYAVTSSHVTDPNVAYINKNNTFTGTQSFDNISVAGTGSFGYLKTITGSATIIGDQYVILNADSPTARFAGIKVYDSGSGLTGSFEWDSVDDNWIQVETGGSSAGMLTGVSGSKGSETYPTNNTILKGTGNHTVVDSSITDDGTVKINSNTQITGSLNVTGSVRALGGQIQLGDTASGNSINIPESGTSIVRGNTDFNDGAFYFGGQLNFGDSLNSSGGGSTVNLIDGTDIQIKADMNLSASKQLIGTASYAMFAETASYINPLVQDVQITGSVSIDGSIVTQDLSDSITAGGYIYSINGDVTSGTGLRAGWAGNAGSVKILNSGSGGLQFPAIEAYTNTTDYTQVFASMRIRDTNPTGSITAQPLSMELSSYTGKDGVYPVAQFRLGPIEGGDSDNTAFWSSENYPGLQFEKSATFNDAVTISSSLNVSGSTDIDGVLSLPGITNVSASIAAGGGGSTSPAGVDTQLQYNDGGSFGAGSFLTTNKSSKVDVTYELGLVGDGSNQGLLKLYCESGTAHHVGLKGPNHSGGSTYTLQFPNTLPSVANQVLESDASGTLSWIATPGSTAFPFTGSANVSGSVNVDGDITTNERLTVGSTDPRVGSNKGIYTDRQSRFDSSISVESGGTMIIDTDGYNSAIPLRVNNASSLAQDTFTVHDKLDALDVTIAGVTKITGSLQVTGSTDITGNITQQGSIISTGGMSTGTALSPVQFPSNYLYLDTEGFGNGYSGFQIINQRSGSTALAGQLEMTTFSGLDGSNPIFGNKFDSNYLWWTSQNFPQFNVRPKLVAEAGVDITGSLNVSGSQTLTGSLDVLGNTDINGTLSLPGITDVSASIASAGGGGSPGLVAGSGTDSMQSAAALTPTQGASAGGTDSIALGEYANASDPKCVAIGRNARATASDAIALANNAFAGNTDAIVIGNNAETFQTYGVAIGSSAVAGASGAVALGRNVTSSTANTTAVNLFQITQYASMNYADDTAAAAGGIPLGGVYHTSGALKIRVT